MAPPLEYDKEPKAPDKSAATISNDDSKLLHNIVNDQQPNSDHKPSNTAANSEVENNKQVVNLDDGQLRALLDEAMNYKCPKDLEGKSNLFKELLEEVQQDDQQDDQASSAAARSVTRSTRRAGGGRARSQLLQSNSLQDLVAALAAEPAPRRARHQPAHPPAPVSARAIQGGSLPSGVDTSFLLGEEPSRGAGYLATVRCVNPPPLAERRVSASDANSPAEVESLHRRSKPVFPMTYTARATLEIGSAAVCSGRAVTTTTASNQVRTAHTLPPTVGPPDRLYAQRPRHVPERTRPRAAGERLSTSAYAKKQNVTIAEVDGLKMTNQMKLMDALSPREDKLCKDGDGSSSVSSVPKEGKKGKPRGPSGNFSGCRGAATGRPQPRPLRDCRLALSPESEVWINDVNTWYDGLPAYQDLFYRMQRKNQNLEEKRDANIQDDPRPTNSGIITNEKHTTNTGPSISTDDIAKGNRIYYPQKKTVPNSNKVYVPVLSADQIKYVPKNKWPAKLNTDESLDFVQEDYLLHRVEDNSSDTEGSDISLRKIYREKVGRNLVPSLTSINPKNIRSMTISKAPIIEFNEARQSTDVIQTTNDIVVSKDSNSSIIKDTNVSKDKVLNKTEKYIDSHKPNNVSHNIEEKSPKAQEVIDMPIIDLFQTDLNSPTQSVNYTEFEMDTIEHSSVKSDSQTDEIELVDIVSQSEQKHGADSFQQFCVEQQNLFKALEATNENDTEHIDSDEISKIKVQDFSKNQTMIDGTVVSSIEEGIELKEITSKDKLCNLEENSTTDFNIVEEHNNENPANVTDDAVIQFTKIPQERTSNEQYILAELPNNAYVFLTLPKRLLTPLNNTDQKPPLQLCEVENDANATSNPLEVGVGTVTNKKKKDKTSPSGAKKKDALNKNALRVLLFENLKRDVSVIPGTSVAGDEGDSAIPFSCITTPEVVASCNTTSSTAQSAIAVDPKPLQLGSGYRAVASLTGAAPAEPAPEPVAEPAPEPPRQLQVFVPRLGLQPRGAGAAFNGLPLSRPNYGATATSAPEEYKKSLDENGNAVQGFGSPVSGSSQHKKPRRKKSSKNETVIKSDQIDGYKGDKDLNEVLRFIESAAEHGRGKLGRKHDDDKPKKRSAERRKDKDKPKRASSLEELSRTKLEDLTEPRPPAPAPKPERRSWGDDARDLYYRAPSPPPELTDFQTVTKRRKPRRRPDEPEHPPPRRPRPPDPRARRESAPPSDRSNDSNDDLDSVHSLPPEPRAGAAAPPHASYADIARTRHNIPDLIESCNFYAEGEGGTGAGERRGGEAPPAGAGDADYPALGLRARAKPQPRRGGKGAPPPPAPDCPAPDVVADRRPPVILLDSAQRLSDMDGVTFGFDINEQLLGAPPRRPRCDLVRDAIDTQVPPTNTITLPPGALGAVGARGLRFVPPAPPPDTRHLHQLVDYVGSAWEDVVRCGAGKVRYFSE